MCEHLKFSVLVSLFQERQKAHPDAVEAGKFYRQIIHAVCGPNQRSFIELSCAILAASAER